MTEAGRRAESGSKESVAQDPPSSTGALRADAFRAMFEAESSFLWNSLRRLGVPARDLDDIAHDVFLTAYRRFDDYDPARPCRPWLFGIAFRTVRRYRDLARHGREVGGDLGDDAMATAADQGRPVDEQLAAAQARRMLAQALDTLDLDRRAVFVMHDIDSCAMPEIAAVLGVPLNTAYSRLRLARAQVKQALSRLRARESVR